MSIQINVLVIRLNVSIKFVHLTHILRSFIYIHVVPWTIRPITDYRRLKQEVKSCTNCPDSEIPARYFRWTPEHEIWLLGLITCTSSVSKINSRTLFALTVYSVQTIKKRFKEINAYFKDCFKTFFFQDSAFPGWQYFRVIWRTLRKVVIGHAYNKCF